MTNDRVIGHLEYLIRRITYDPELAEDKDWTDLSEEDRTSIVAYESAIIAIKKVMNKRYDNEKS